MQNLLFSFMMIGSSMSYSQTTTTVQENAVMSVVTTKITIGNVTVEKVEKESRLNVQQLVRPEKVRKEEVIEEKKDNQ
ncbi:MAG: hypothetical protein P8M19_01355 [Crocinitomicaceae bacterium]|jgi:hypothetical protein|nr:hypothetical protein [Crocinitomicaceae bacterium]MDG1657822.1 hypothetical protein [Crocinitomicaceae bacterium]MDG2440291.1 hypothetical protein [Crocinitomicaceae bacterium]|tara:strand:- start:175 stop:408 length:234 start_codon:yes stop_codon:yes gene_type:complete